MRCFEEATLTLHYPGDQESAALHYPNINLLLGNNGAGKTTVLKALALSTLSPMISQSGYLPYHLVRRGFDSGDIATVIRLHEQDMPLTMAVPKGAYELKVQVTRQKNAEILQPLQSNELDSQVWSAMYDDSSQAFLILGYGATRRVQELTSYNPDEHMKRRLLRYQRVASLFESQFSLVPLASWLPRLEIENPGRFKQVINLFNQILPSDTRFNGRRDSSSAADYLFEREGATIPFGALSDGYRSFIGWIADMLYHICMGAAKGAKLKDNRGLVLIDEIDAYLHPAWQRTVVGSISKALPNLQFVLTTHSPIVAGSLQRENIYVMEENSRGASTIHQYEERIYGMDAEQVLLSSYFGLTSTRASGFIDEMASLSKLAKPGRPEVALEIMQRLSGQLQGVRPLASQGSKKGSTRRAKSSPLSNKSQSLKRSSRRPQLKKK
jgi:predicted ATP-binding protein involved in virulence